VEPELQADAAPAPKVTFNMDSFQKMAETEIFFCFSKRIFNN
jgi:hypothetical protein